MARRRACGLAALGCVWVCCVGRRLSRRFCAREIRCVFAASLSRRQQVSKRRSCPTQDELADEARLEHEEEKRLPLENMRISARRFLTVLVARFVCHLVMQLRYLPSHCSYHNRLVLVTVTCRPQISHKFSSILGVWALAYCFSVGVWQTWPTRAW